MFGVIYASRRNNSSNYDVPIGKYTTGEKIVLTVVIIVLLTIILTGFLMAILSGSYVFTLYVNVNDDNYDGKWTELQQIIRTGNHNIYKKVVVKSDKDIPKNVSLEELPAVTVVSRLLIAKAPGIYYLNRNYKDENGIDKDVITRIMIDIGQPVYGPASVSSQ